MQYIRGVHLENPENSWWKKAAENVVGTVKDKLVKKEPVIEPNFGKTHPEVMECIRERSRADVIHVWELGKFKSESEELFCYGVIFKEESAVELMSSFRSIFVACCAGQVRLAVSSHPILFRDEMLRNVISSEFSWLSSTYTTYKEFASSKPWVKYDPRAFEEFRLSKAKK